MKLKDYDRFVVVKADEEWHSRFNDITGDAYKEFEMQGKIDKSHYNAQFDLKKKMTEEGYGDIIDFDYCICVYGKQQDIGSIIFGSFALILIICIFVFYRISDWSETPDTVANVRMVAAAMIVVALIVVLVTWNYFKMGL